MLPQSVRGLHFLGDIIDRGPDSRQAMDLVYGAVRDNRVFRLWGAMLILPWMHSI